MTRITLSIWDDGEEVHAESSMDNPNAVNEPPTGALIIGTYLAANFDEVARTSMVWFKTQVGKEQEAEAAPVKLAESHPKLILPDNMR